MPLLSATQLVDGRPTHQVLAIEERYDSVTISVAPRHVRTGTAAGLLALFTFTAGLWGLLVACALGEGEGSFGYRLLVVGLLALPPLAAVALLAMRIRKAMNWRTVTVGDGLVTVECGPVWPVQQTLQLSSSDGMRVSYRERRGRRWTLLRKEQPEPVREYCIFVSGTRGKSDWDVELIPPFTLSQHEASKLAALMQKFAYPPSEEALIGSRI